MDPRARRFLWSIIRGVVGAGQSVLLTTHSMAECEALCSRVGIMVNGVFCCLGTPQQLKSSYGEGYRLKVRAGSGGGIEPVKEFVRQNFSNSVLKVGVWVMSILQAAYKLHSLLLSETSPILTHTFIYPHIHIPSYTLTYTYLHIPSHTHTRSHTPLQEEHFNTLVYQLPLAGLQLSKVFEVMENARETLDIQVTSCGGGSNRCYCVCQS